MTRYPIVALCGSTRFKEEFLKAQERLTLAGNIVLSVGLFGYADAKCGTVITPDVKTMLDDMCKARIDMADTVFIINPDGYIGESTASEIAYAKEKGKLVAYLYDSQAEKKEMRYPDFEKDTAYRVVAGDNDNLCEGDVFGVNSFDGGIIFTGKHHGFLDADEIDEDFFSGLTISLAPEYKVLTSPNGSVLLGRINT